MSVPEPVNLLLVDDVPANLVALAAILDAPDHRVVTATTGEEALALALREELAVVLLDVCMPGMDGFEVAAHLRRLQRTRHVPIIFVTAVATEVEQVYRAYSVGGVDYLVKPLDAAVVRGKVAIFVELHRQRRELARQADALREAQRREHELRLAELRLASDTRYRKFVEGIDHVITWSADPDTLHLSFVSRQAEAVLGWPIERISGPGFWLAQLHPDDRASFLRVVERARRERIDQACDHRMLASDGGVRWFHTGLSVEPPLLGGTPELHGVSADVTDLKRAEETALAATRAREELLAVVSHDLRTPLHAIAMCVDRIARAAGQPEVQARAIAMITRNARSMNRLLDDLLDLGRIEHDRLVLEPRAMDARALAADSVELLEPLARERGVALRLDVDALGAAWVTCDGDRTHQVFMNIVGNAIKFSPDGGEVVVRGERRRSDVRFAITDQGPGVPREHAARVFERYWQGPDAGRGGARVGLGLGLAIAKAIIEAHGGQIGVDAAPGPGSTFFFTLPLAASTSPPAPPALAVEPRS